MSILVLGTGGTIATPDTTGVKIPELNADQLIEAVPELATLGDIITDDIFTKPSTHLTLTDGLQLVARLDEADNDPEVDAVIVTHGTDTLEESAYLADVCYSGDTPVAFTGAMRKPTQSGADGPANVWAAARIVTDSQATDYGILVVENDRAFTARDVTKAHANRVGAFTAPDGAPIATIAEDRVTFRGQAQRDSLTFTPDPEALTDDVVIVTATLGQSSRLANAAIDAAGIILAGTGGGHISPTLVGPLEAAAKTGTPIVVTTRCFAGEPTRHSYDIVGGEKTLQELGAFYSSLFPWKARIKLAIAAASTHSLSEVFDTPTIATKSDAADAE